jgi:AraC-like DNA-binding protein
MIERMLSVAIKNQEQPLHWHDALEINFILEGEVDVALNNRTIHASAGEMMVLNRGDVHTISSPSEDFLYVQMHLDLERFNAYIPDISDVLFFWSPEHDSVIAQNLKIEMRSHISTIVKLMTTLRDNVDAEKKIVYYCIDILSSLKMEFVAGSEQGRRMRTKEQEERLWKVIAYVYDNYNKKLTLHEVAQQAYVSDGYLSKILKKEIGRGFSEFLGLVRSEMSLRLLLNSDMSVTNIAYESGFSAPKYYKSVFQEMYGCTPSEYREQNQANFFIEKQKEYAGIQYDEGVDPQQALNQIKKYRAYFYEQNIIKQNVALDIGEIGQNGKWVTEADLFAYAKKRAFGLKEQQLLSEIRYPCVRLDKNTYVWKEGEAVKILLLNSYDPEKKEYLLKITGLDPRSTYIYCREKTPDLPESLQNAIKAGRLIELNRDMISHLNKMTFEYGEISASEELYMDIDLKEKQIARITIQKYDRG